MLNELVKTGSELHVVCKSDEHLDVLLSIQGVKFHPLLNPKRLPIIVCSIINLFEIWRKIYTIKPTHIFSFTIFSNLPCGLYKRLFKSNSRVYVNITGLGRLEPAGKTSIWTDRLLLLAFSRVDGIFVQNSGHAIRFSKINKNIISLPGSGVDLSKFKYLEPRISDEINVLMSARVLALKGVETYIKAAYLAKLKSKNVNFSYCTGFGSTFDSPLSRKLFQAAEDDAIELINATRDVPALVSGFDIIVLPTLYGEGIPKSLIEAQAMGIYIIASGMIGNKDLLEKTRYGAILNEVTPDNILLEIDKFSQFDHKLRSSMAKKARKQVEQHFGENLVIEQYLECLNKTS